MKTERIIVTVLRLILALVFIFSGFVKVVDPWGMALKLNEYFTAYGVEWLSWSRFHLGVIIPALELTLGLALLVGARLKITSFLVMLFMVFFTVLTFISAVWDTVEDCGCFGDVVKLTNWQTFFKNLILLPISVFVWWGSRMLPDRRCCKADIIVISGLIVISLGVGYYSLLHLPIVDFSPYRVGTDLAGARSGGEAGDVETTLVYRDRQTGKNREFELSDTTWYDTVRWEYVDTKIVHARGSKPSVAAEFAVFNGDWDITEDILSSERPVYLLCTYTLANISEKNLKRFERAVIEGRHNHARIICVTPAPVSQKTTLDFGQNKIDCFNIDATLLKTMLRSPCGLIVIQDGVITDKRSCTDL